MKSVGEMNKWISVDALTVLLKMSPKLTPFLLYFISLSRQSREVSVFYYKKKALCYC